MNFELIFQEYLKLINRFLPKPARPVVIGIDIGTSSIKAVEIALIPGNGYEIRHWAIEPIEANDAKSALARLMTKLNLAEKVPVTSVSGKGTLIRYIDLPRIPLDDLRKSFVYDLDKYFPFDPQSIYSDCNILDPQSKDKKMSVLVAAVKKEMIDERLKLFKDVGFELSHITTNSIATANAFEVLGPKVSNSGHAKAILDIGGSVSNLIILKDLSPRFTRDIFVGSHELTKQISNVLGVDFAQAEILKTAPGDKHDQIISACETPINNLITEIRLSLDYFMTEKNIQVDELFLVGGGSLLKGIEASFEKNLGMPVKIWDPLNGIRLSEQVAAGDIKNYSSQLGVAIGLGLVNV